MITFIISIVALVLGYVIYGAVIERIVAPNDSPTPAVRLADGVDYVAMPTWKVFMIQFLNIAGTGPIFGAIMGIWFGPAAFLWIVLGCIFAGAVHDYLSGMLSMRHDGANLPTLIGNYLGTTARRVMLAFTVMLMLMVGAVFVYSPAIIMAGISGSQEMWIVIIFIYYLVAAMLPIDKIIGKIYPVFAVSLLFMAVALMALLLVKMPHLPELWDMGNMQPWHQSLMVGDKDGLGIVAFMQKNPLFPCLFITIACGAISGFHATQSPLMARCLKSERLGRKIFYGSMRDWWHSSGPACRATSSMPAAGATWCRSRRSTTSWHRCQHPTARHSSSTSAHRLWSNLCAQAGWVPSVASWPCWVWWPPPSPVATRPCAVRD